MAPSIAETVSDPVTSNGSSLKKSVFPDGLKTSGKHNPIYSLLRPYEDFPKEISGPTVWKADHYRDHPERWTHVFSPGEIDELGNAADNFIPSSTPLTGISRVSVPAFNHSQRLTYIGPLSITNPSSVSRECP